MKRNVKALSIMLVMLSFSMIAQADSDYWELSPILGDMFGGHFKTYVPEYGETEVKQDNSFYLGLRSTYFFSPYSGFEIALGYTDTAFLLDESSGFFDEDQELLTDLSILSVGGSFTFNFVTGSATPFFDIGMGVNVYDMEEPGYESKARWFFSMGGGVKFFFNDYVGMRINARSYYTFMDVEENHDEWDNDEYEGLSSVELSVGMVFRFE